MLQAPEQQPPPRLILVDVGLAAAVAISTVGLTVGMAKSGETWGPLVVLGTIAAALGGVVAGWLARRCLTTQLAAMIRRVALSALAVTLIAAPLSSIVWAQHFTLDECCQNVVMDGTAASASIAVATLVLWGVIVGLRPRRAADRWRAAQSLIPAAAFAGVIALATLLFIVVFGLALSRTTATDVSGRTVTLTNRSGTVAAAVSLRGHGQAAIACAGNSATQCKDIFFSTDQVAAMGGWTLAEEAAIETERVMGGLALLLLMVVLTVMVTHARKVGGRIR